MRQTTMPSGAKVTSTPVGARGGSGGSARRWTAVLGVAVVFGAVSLLAWSSRAVSGWLEAPVASAPVAQADVAEQGASQAPRVLVFYNPSGTRECIECQLHALRFAYYAYAFEQAGAEVLGVVGDLHEGSASLDPNLALPWQTVYDLSGGLAEFYGIERRRNPNPTIVVLDGAGLVRYRGQPRGVDDRIEGEVLTSIAAAVREQGGERTVARVAP